MSVVDEHEADRVRLAALEAELAEMRQQMAELRAQVRGGPGEASPSADAPAPFEGGDEGARSVSRRGLIAGAAGAVVAGAAVIVGNAAPAAANSQGQSLTLGDFTNSCTTTTGLHATNVGPVLMVTSYGNDASNAAQFYVHDATGTGAVTHHETAGIGPAAEFIASNTASTASAVAVNTSGNGSAGSFVVTKTSNTAAGLGVLHRGTGSAVNSVNSGGGSAGFFGANGAKEALFVAMTGTGSALVVNSTSTTSTNPTMSVQTTAPAPAIRAKGPITNLSLSARTSGGAPTADTVSHSAGDLVEDSTGTLWVCVTGGTPGQWRKLAGPATAGALHVLSTPVRIYDSRPGTSPAIGSKTKLASNVARPVDLTVNSSGVPAGAIAAMVTLLIVNAAPGSANFTLWKNGTAQPSSNTMVWGGSVGRFSTLAVTSLDPSGKAQVASSVATDVVIDVVGYYR